MRDESPNRNDACHSFSRSLITAGCRQDIATNHPPQVDVDVKHRRIDKFTPQTVATAFQNPVTKAAPEPPTRHLASLKTISRWIKATTKLPQPWIKVSLQCPHSKSLQSSSTSYSHPLLHSLLPKRQSSCTQLPSEPVDGTASALQRLCNNQSPEYRHTASPHKATHANCALCLLEFPSSLGIHMVNTY